MNSVISIEKIRSTFSKASICLQGSELVVIFRHNEEGFFVQSIDGDYKECVCTLLNSAQSIQVVIKNGEGVKFIFRIPDKFGIDGKVVFPPINRDMTTEEIIDKIQQKGMELDPTSKERDSNIALLKQYVTELDDMETFYSQLSKFFNYISEKNPDYSAIDFEAICTYDHLKDIGTKLIKYIPTIDFTKPHKGEYGYIAFTVDNRLGCKNIAEIKQYLIDLFTVSKSISIEGEDDSDSVELTFFS